MTSLRPSLDPDPETMRRLGHAVVDLVVDHLAGLGERPVSKLGPIDELVAEVDAPLPEEGAPVEAALDFFRTKVQPRMTCVNHPRFHGYLPAPGSFYAALGDILAAGTNPFVGSWLGGGSMAALELVVLRWIAEAIGTDPEAPGCLTSGGSMANLIGLGAARARLSRDDPEGWRQARVYVSSEAHGSVEKAARVLGFSSEHLVILPARDDFRMDVDALRRHLDTEGRPGVVCAAAGTTNTGTIDPLDELAELCAERGLWYHVDAAYGGFAALSPELRPRLRGMQRADSLTLDPHKWMGASMGTGCSFVRDPDALKTAFASHGGYLRDVDRSGINFFERGPELSRPARVLSSWMLLSCAGRRRLQEQVEWDLHLARHAAELLRAEPAFELVAEPELSVLAFRHRAAEGESEDQRAARDERLLQRVFEDGELLVSSTRLHERSAIRFVVMNHRSTQEHVERSIRRLRELAVPR